MNWNLNIVEGFAKLLRAVWAKLGFALAFLAAGALAILIGVIYGKGK